MPAGVELEEAVPVGPAVAMEMEPRSVVGTVAEVAVPETVMVWATPDSS